MIPPKGLEPLSEQMGSEVIGDLKRDMSRLLTHIEVVPFHFTLEKLFQVLWRINWMYVGDLRRGEALLNQGGTPCDLVEQLAAYQNVTTWTPVRLFRGRRFVRICREVCLMLELCLEIICRNTNIMNRVILKTRQLIGLMHMSGDHPLQDVGHTVSRLHKFELFRHRLETQEQAIAKARSLFPSLE